MTVGTRSIRRRTGSRTHPTTRPGGETAFRTSGDTLSNARTRIVGNRTGLLADALVALVRATAAGRAVTGRLGRRVAAVVTPLGWTMLAVVPLGLGIGYALAWTELIVVGYAGAVLLVVAALYLIGRTRIGLELGLGRDRVVVGGHVDGVVTARNPGRRRQLGVTVEVPVGPGLAEFSLPAVGVGASVEHRFAIPALRRGVVSIGPLRTVRADPVGLVRRELIWAEASDLIVHPRTIAIPSTSTGLIRDLEGAPTRDLSTSDVSFHALREYQPGDERRTIHWKSTAKTGRHMVRQFEETRRSHIMVALSLASADFASEEEFELAVSAAGSIGARAIRDGRTVSVVVSEKTPDFAKRKVFAVRRLAAVSRMRLLDDLAVVERAEAALDIAEVALVSAERVDGLSIAILVVGSPPAAAALRTAAAVFPAGVEVVVVQCDPEAPPARRRLAALTVLTVGSLDDLARAVAFA